MHKLILFAPAALAGLFLTGCAEDGYDRGYAYNDRPGYYDEGNVGVDFVYEGDRPYSRSYGPLFLRDGNYYYSRGGEYVVYDRPTRAYNTRVVNREVNVRNVAYNNRTSVVRGGGGRTYAQRDGNVRSAAYSNDGGFHGNRSAGAYGNQSYRSGRQAQVRTSDHGRAGMQVQGGEKKKKKNRD